MFEQIPTFQNIGDGAYKPGLERVLALSEAFGNPHQQLRAIHIAGTNGKGSTASLVAAILQSAGYRVGLFTSPHLVDFRERIRINGEMISENDVVDFIKKYREKCSGIEPSFFELTTVMAFDYFAREGVDFAVIEAGLGGRLDSTNILTPLLSIITNISMDHTALLGDTPAKIAFEKAGIIKPGVPVVIGRADGDVRQVFERRAAECGSPISFAQDTPLLSVISRDFDSIDYHSERWGDIHSVLGGDCQPENANTVLYAISLLPIDISAEAVRAAFARVTSLSGLAGRWMVLQHSPTVVCDTGHNPGGWEYLGPRLRHIADNADLHIVLGFVNDKDISHILCHLPANARYYFTQPSVKRGRPASEVRDLSASFGLKGSVYNTVAEAYTAALGDAQPSATIFVGGSSYVVADLFSQLNISLPHR